MTTQDPLCPCAGRCHHSEAPCSLGCWAAQKPWRAEEAALAAAPVDRDGLRDRIRDAVAVHVGTMRADDVTDDVLAALSAPKQPEDSRAEPGQEPGAGLRECGELLFGDEGQALGFCTEVGHSAAEHDDFMRYSATPPTEGAER